jgi:rsbT co-antagonist protein RsbR
MKMTEKDLLKGLSPGEVESESATIYDTCVECLDTGQYTGAERYARKMAERGVLRGMTTEQIIGGLLVLRDVYGRSLFEKYQDNMPRLLSALDTYEPVANKILSIVIMTLLEEREKTIQQSQEVIRELSTPVLLLRKKLLVLPIVGVLDSNRAKQLTEQLLRSIRANRARVVVVDITGVPAIDSKVANHLIQTVEAVRLLGAAAIVTGLSPEVAQTVVTIGVDLSRIKTFCDLQSGIEEADKLLGYKIIMPAEDTI